MNWREAAEFLQNYLEATGAPVRRIELTNNATLLKIWDAQIREFVPALCAAPTHPGQWVAMRPDILVNGLTPPALLPWAHFAGKEPQA